MKNRIMEIAQRAILTALGLGVAGDALFHDAHGAGVNVALWTALAIAALVWLSKTAGHEVTAQNRWLLGLVQLCSILPALRDSPALRFYDALAALFALSLMGSFCRDGVVAVRGLLDYGSAAGRTIANSVFLSPWILRDADLGKGNAPDVQRVSAARLRGFAIACPLFLVFAGLLAGADPVFAHYVHTLISWNPVELFENATTILAFTWVSAGFLRMVLLREGSPAPVGSPEPILGRTEVKSVLGSLDLLFGAFVAV